MVWTLQEQRQIEVRKQLEKKRENLKKKKKKVIVLRSVKRNAHHAAVVLEMDKCVDLWHSL